MVAESLIAALAREHQKQVLKAARQNDPEEFKRRFSALYGQGAKQGADPAGTAPADPATPPADPSIWEEDETPPERLPDLPTVPDDPPGAPDVSQDAQERPATTPESETKPTTPPEAVNAPTGRFEAIPGAVKGKKPGKAGRGTKKRPGKGRK